MKPCDFAYHAPNSLSDAVSLLTQYGGDAKLLAGGQSLMPLLNMRLARPEALIDLNRIDSLRHISAEDSAVLIGAMTTHRAVETSDLVRTKVGLLSEAVLEIGHRQIRNRGTHGGSLVHADPAAELPVVALALDAELEVLGPSGTRTLPVADLFLGFLTTSLAPDEIVTAVRWPVWTGTTGFAFQEVARRKGDFALVSVAVQVSLDGEGRCSRVAIAMGGVGPAPVRAAESERVLQGELPGPERIQSAADLAAQSIDPDADLHASSQYRRHVAGVLVRRALHQALERAGGVSRV